MPKRFTATEKWIDPWFCELSKDNKLLWIYLLDNCDHAGIWQVNLPLVRHYFGLDFSVNTEIFKSRIVFLSDFKWFIPKFVEFQYGTLDESNRAHFSVIQKLKKEGAYKGLNRSIQGRKDKDKDKDKETDTESVVGGLGGGFELFWEAYPKKVGRKPCEKIWDRIVPGQDVLEKILRAIKDQMGSQNWQRGFIPNPETWLNQERWNDDAGALKGGENGSGGKTGSGRIVGGAAPVPGKYDKIDAGKK